MFKLKLWGRLGAVVVWAGLLILPGLVTGQTDPWLEPWAARHEVSVPNSCGTELNEYQVKITLGASFDFGGALADGSDVMVTDAGGLDCIPFWVEEWDPGSSSACIWVRVPVIPVTGTSVYLYYGLDSPPVPDPPELMEVGPIGPWVRQDTNIVPLGGPAEGSSLLAENMVYDDSTDHYWLVFADYNNGSVGLAWTDTPDDPDSWEWHGTVVTSANAPHILYHDSLWYIFYADQSYGRPGRPISVATSPTINGTYTFAGTVLETDPTPGSWQYDRVDEPYVFQRNDGKWIMMYMGDAGGNVEQVGYAEADSVLGPYTKFAGNPCIPFGPPGSYDAGTVADAWVVELDGVYYIGYTVSQTTSSPWRTALATTEDWLTFTKHGIILDWGGPGDWDERNAFRGAVSRFNDTYYFSYTGRRTSGGYLMGMATMDVNQLVYPPACDDPEAVFEFIDNFDGSSLDTDKWIYTVTSGTAGDVTVGGGVCTLEGMPGSYVQLRATSSFGPGVLLETHAVHHDAGLSPGSAQGNTAAEVGYKPYDMAPWSNVIRIMDWPDLQKYCVQLSSAGVATGYLVTDMDFDAAWHTYRVFRDPAGTVDFQIDANAIETFGPASVPAMDLYPWLMSYSRSPATQSRFDVDWLRVRKYCGTPTAVTVGAVQYPDATIYGYVYGEGTGLYGVPLILMNDETPPVPVGDAVTDDFGYYEFADVLMGAYTVTVSTPLGYTASVETQAVSLMGVDVQVDFNLSQAAMTMSQRGRGYWMHQANALLTGKGKAHESLSDMCRYMELIGAHFNQHQINPITIFDVDLGADCMTTLEALRVAISPRPKSSMEDKAKAHLTALLLNMVSGKLAQWAVISADGATVSQAITYCDLLIGDMDPSNDEMARDIAEMVNEGTTVPAGWIDLSTPDYAYKIGLVPLSYGVSQNYPNPFNPSTNVSYTIPQPGLVTLDVFNILGQRVKTLVNGHQAAGRFTVTWHGDDDSGNPVATGIYLFRFTAGDFMETKKMMMLK